MQSQQILVHRLMRRMEVEFNVQDIQEVGKMGSFILSC